MTLTKQQLSFVFSLVGMIGLSILLSSCNKPKELLPKKEIDEAYETFRMAEQSGAQLFVHDQWKSLENKELELRQERDNQEKEPAPDYARVIQIAGELKSSAEAVRQKAIEQYKNALRGSESFLLVPNTRKLTMYQYQVRLQDDLIGEHPEIQEFIKLGLVTIQPYKVYFGKPIGSVVTLTQAGENERQSAGWKEIKDGEYSAWQVVLAKKVLIGDPPLPTPSSTSNEFTVTVKWRWEPNKFGKAFGVSSQENETKLKIFLENGKVVFEPVS